MSTFRPRRRSFHSLSEPQQAVLNTLRRHGPLEPKTLVARASRGPVRTWLAVADLLEAGWIRKGRDGLIHRVPQS